MRALIVNSKDLAASPDNAAGRWDVGFHALRLSCIRLANGIAQSPGDYDERIIFDLARGDRERAVIRSAIHTAGSKEEIYQILLRFMKLESPRPELRRGLEDIARRLAHENALRITKEAGELLKRAAALKT
jgi:hypothetical protein